MRAYWPELEGRVLENLDLLSDAQLTQLLRIPHWQGVIQREQEHLSVETQERLDALHSRSAIARVWHYCRRKLQLWALPEGLTLPEAKTVLRRYHEKVAEAKRLLHTHEQIGLMNEVIDEQFPHLNDAERKAIRFYCYEQENLIGAN